MTTSISAARNSPCWRPEHEWSRRRRTCSRRLADSPPSSESVAGFRGRASSPAAFWQMLRSWHPCRPATLLPVGRAPAMCQIAGRSRPVDPVFFGISPREHPQLGIPRQARAQAEWEALWDAGCAPGTLAGSPQAFLSVSSSGSTPSFLPEDPRRLGLTPPRSELSMGSGRVSFLLDLRGPSVVVDTACLSYSIAIHLACQSLRSGETRMTLAGGVTLKFDRTTTPGSRKWVCSPATACSKASDARANGFVPGEGCGLVVLKRLADALADGDRSTRSSRGTPANQDGRHQHDHGAEWLVQQQVVRAALENARVGAAGDRLCGNARHGHGAG